MIEYRVVDNRGKQAGSVTRIPDEAREDRDSCDDRYPDFAPFVLQRREVTEWGPVP